jgi:hypothetical protein
MDRREPIDEAPENTRPKTHLRECSLPGMNETNHSNEQHNHHSSREEESIPDTLRMITHEDAARAALRGIVCDLGLDEVRVLTRIAERLQMGARQYGRLYLALDPRAFRGKEAREELEDTLVYLACAWLKEAGKATL